MKPNDKERVVVEVVQRVLEENGSGERANEALLFDAIYEERRRLERYPNDPRAGEDRAFFDAIQRKAAKASPERQRELLRRLAERFTEEVTGHFNPAVYTVATRVLPPALSLLLNSMSPIRLLSLARGKNAGVVDQVHLTGATESLQRLAKLGTTVLVPTHYSNLDSILVGLAVYLLGLPPYTYGAGLNLFSNPILGYFMHNLGAYKVDRRKKAAVYKAVLKNYAGCSMELGYHNLFFPGGTRSRSGAAEKSLKRGLLGMGLSAYIRNLQARRAQPDIFVIPCTINYQLVLEAETLIEDYLKDAGKSRYIIEDDEFSNPRIVLDFFSKLLSLNSTVTLRFGQPLDVFGNRVDDEGRSHDRRGRLLDRSRYVLVDGKPQASPQRDAEYTTELAASVVDSYDRNSVVTATSLLAYVVFEHLLTQNPGLDLYRLLRTGGADASTPATVIYSLVEATLEQLRETAAEGRVQISDLLKTQDVVAIVGDALAHFGCFHLRPAITRRGDRVFHEDMNLIYFYRNRLAGLSVLGGQS